MGGYGQGCPLLCIDTNASLPSLNYIVSGGLQRNPRRHSFHMKHRKSVYMEIPLYAAYIITISVRG